MPVSDINVNSPSALQQQSRQAVAYTQGQGKPVASSGVTGYGKVQGKPFQGKPVSRGGGGYSVYVQPRPMVQTPVMQKIESPAVQQIRQKIAMGQFEQGGGGAVVLAVAQNVRNQRAISEFESQGQKLQQEIDLYNKSNIGDYKSLNQRVTEFNARGQELQQKLVNENKATTEKIQQIQSPLPFGGIKQQGPLRTNFDIKATSPQPKVSTVVPIQSPETGLKKAILEDVNKFSTGLKNPKQAYVVSNILTSAPTRTISGSLNVASELAGSGAYAVTGDPYIKGAFEFSTPIFLLEGPRLLPNIIGHAASNIQLSYFELKGGGTKLELADQVIQYKPINKIPLSADERLARQYAGFGQVEEKSLLQSVEYQEAFKSQQQQFSRGFYDFLDIGERGSIGGGARAQTILIEKPIVKTPDFKLWEMDEYFGPREISKTTSAQKFIADVETNTIQATKQYYPLGLAGLSISLSPSISKSIIAPTQLHALRYENFTGLGLLSSFSIKQIQIAEQTQKYDEDQIKVAKVAVGQKMVFAQPQKYGASTITQQIQSPGFEKLQVQEFSFKEPVREPYNPPKEPTVRMPPQPNFNLQGNKRKRTFFNLETKSTSAFNVFIRRRGKFKLVGSNLPKGRATQLGASIAIGTLARSFKLAPSGFTQIQDIPYTASSNLFRPGRSRALAGAFVQRSRFSLSSAGERLEIRQARRSRRSML